MPIRRHLTVLAIGASVCAVVAGCTTDTASTESTSSKATTSSSHAASAPAAQPAPPGLEKFYTQTVDWGSCDGYATDGQPLKADLQCTHITVPIDYDKPDGPQAKIAVSRSRATGQKIGSLLMNPGGPGASGLGLAAQGAGTRLAERFDVVGFDPRGIGASTPSVKCLTPKESDADRANLDVDMSPAGIAETEQEHRDYAAKCVERSGADLLEHVGTRDVIKDMDVIRAALGDDKLNYVGYSYGTRLGSAYAEAFPDKVRAMVLDGAVDPEQNPIDEQLNQAAGFQKAFDAYVADCARSKDCPLGNDPAKAVGAFQALFDPIIDQPVKTNDPRGLNYNDAMTGVQQALYSPEIWRVLTAGLKELKEGRGDTLLKLADIYDGRSDDGNYTNLADAFNAVRCVDDPRVMDRAAVGAADTKNRQVAPFADDGRGTGQAPLGMCAFWPVPNTSQPHTISVHGLPDTVVVSTTEDPATPYQAGVDLAKQLGGSLITYKGTQHTVALSGVKCVDGPVIDYLVDLKKPADGLTC